MSPAPQSPCPPRLALVFGSGGVKSVAALGVVEVLEQAGLRPDLVVGCSAGALFGALVAAGHSASEGQALAQRLWSREVTSQRRPRALLDLAMGSTWPRGMPDFGQRFALRDDRLICQRLHQAFGEQRLEQLPIPLLVQASDAHSGEPVVLRQGRLCDALRASVALPFLFTPQRIGARWLVDGSVSDPLPVAAAAHAQVVLAIGFPVPAPLRVSGPSRLATRVTAALTNNLMQARLSAHAGPSRIVLLPTLARRVGLFETEAIPELLDLGRQAAWEALPRLAQLVHAAEATPTLAPAAMRRVA